MICFGHLVIDSHFVVLFSPETEKKVLKIKMHLPCIHCDIVNTCNLKKPNVTQIMFRLTVYIVVVIVKQ